jgi:hypothetical protein
VFLSSTLSRRVGSCGFHVFFEWASSLADSGYAKSEDPKGHSLVIRRVVGAECEAETAGVELGVEGPVGACTDAAEAKQTAAAS